MYLAIMKELMKEMIFRKNLCERNEFEKRNMIRIWNSMNGHLRIKIRSSSHSPFYSQIGEDKFLFENAVIHAFIRILIGRSNVR